MWFTFPLLQLGFQFTDIISLFENRTAGATLHGATNVEKATVFAGKLAHHGLLWAVPIVLHGWAATWPAAVAYIFTQGVVLASTFAVSHNIPETKPMFEGAEAIAAQVRIIILSVQPFSDKFAHSGIRSVPLRSQRGRSTHQHAAQLPNA
jgi:hypothetical protein